MCNRKSQDKDCCIVLALIKKCEDFELETIIECKNCATKSRAISHDASYIVSDIL